MNRLYGRSVRRFTYTGLLTVLLFCVSASGQSTGSIQGTVTDPTGAVVSGVKITISPGALWSYNLKAGDNPHACKVERKS